MVSAKVVEGIRATKMKKANLSAVRYIVSSFFDGVYRNVAVIFFLIKEY